MFRLFGNKKKADDSKNLSKTSTQDDFYKILTDWSELCSNNRLIVPSKALKEFKKRIKNCGSKSDAGKPKLNLSNCSLNDDHIYLLFKALEFSPAISKLDISKNELTDRSVAIALEFVRLQSIQASQLHIDERVSYIYLSNLTLHPSILIENGKATQFNEKILNDIEMVTVLLKKANAQSSIRQIYFRIGLLTNELNEAQVNKFVQGALNINDDTKLQLIVNDIMNGQPKVLYSIAEKVIIDILFEQNPNNRNSSLRMSDLRLSGSQSLVSASSYRSISSRRSENSSISNSDSQSSTSRNLKKTTSFMSWFKSKSSTSSNQIATTTATTLNTNQHELYEQEERNSMIMAEKKLQTNNELKSVLEYPDISENSHDICEGDNHTLDSENSQHALSSISNISSSKKNIKRSNISKDEILKNLNESTDGNHINNINFEFMQSNQQKDEDDVTDDDFYSCQNFPITSRESRDITETINHTAYHSNLYRNDENNIKIELGFMDYSNVYNDAIGKLHSSETTGVEVQLEQENLSASVTQSLPKPTSSPTPDVPTISRYNENNFIDTDTNDDGNMTLDSNKNHPKVPTFSISSSSSSSSSSAVAATKTVSPNSFVDRPVMYYDQNAVTRNITSTSPDVNVNRSKQHSPRSFFPDNNENKNQIYSNVMSANSNYENNNSENTSNTNEINKRSTIHNEHQDKDIITEKSVEKFELYDLQWNVYSTEDGRLYYLCPAYDQSHKHSQWHDPRIYGFIEPEFYTTEIWEKLHTPPPVLSPQQQKENHYNTRSITPTGDDYYSDNPHINEMNTETEINNNDDEVYDPVKVLHMTLAYEAKNHRINSSKDGIDNSFMPRSNSWKNFATSSSSSSSSRNSSRPTSHKKVSNSEKRTIENITIITPRKLVLSGDHLSRIDASSPISDIIVDANNTENKIISNFEHDENYNIEKVNTDSITTGSNAMSLQETQTITLLNMSPTSTKASPLSNPFQQQQQRQQQQTNDKTELEIKLITNNKMNNNETVASTSPLMHSMKIDTVHSSYISQSSPVPVSVGATLMPYESIDIIDTTSSSSITIDETTEKTSIQTFTPTKQQIELFHRLSPPRTASSSSFSFLTTGGTGTGTGAGTVTVTATNSSESSGVVIYNENDDILLQNSKPLSDSDIDTDDEQEHEYNDINHKSNEINVNRRNSTKNQNSNEKNQIQSPNQSFSHIKAKNPLQSPSPVINKQHEQYKQTPVKKLHASPSIVISALKRQQQNIISPRIIQHSQEMHQSNEDKTPRSELIHSSKKIKKIVTLAPSVSLLQTPVQPSSSNLSINTLLGTISTPNYTSDYIYSPINQIKENPLYSSPEHDISVTFQDISSSRIMTDRSISTINNTVNTSSRDKLILTQNNITSLSDIYQYINHRSYRYIKYLNLSYNNISNENLSELPQILPRLTYLNLSYNLLVGDLSSNSLPSNIEELDISYNKLTNISSLVNCMKLRELNASYNILKDIIALPQSLQILDISHNMIYDDFICRTIIVCCHDLESINMTGNPFIISNSAIATNQSDKKSEDNNITSNSNKSNNTTSHKHRKPVSESSIRIFMSGSLKRLQIFNDKPLPIAHIRSMKNQLISNSQPINNSSIHNSIPGHNHNRSHISNKNQNMSFSAKNNQKKQHRSRNNDNLSAKKSARQLQLEAQLEQEIKDKQRVDAYQEKLKRDELRRKLYFNDLVSESYKTCKKSVNSEKVADIVSRLSRPSSPRAASVCSTRHEDNQLLGSSQTSFKSLKSFSLRSNPLGRSQRSSSGSPVSRGGLSKRSNSYTDVLSQSTSKSYMNSPYKSPYRNLYSDSPSQDEAFSPILFYNNSEQINYDDQNFIGIDSRKMTKISGLDTSPKSENTVSANVWKYSDDVSSYKDNYNNDKQSVQSNTLLQSNSQSQQRPKSQINNLYSKGNNHNVKDNDTIYSKQSNNLVSQSTINPMEVSQAVSHVDSVIQKLSSVCEQCGSLLIYLFWMIDQDNLTYELNTYLENSWRNIPYQDLYYEIFKSGHIWNNNRMTDKNERMVEILEDSQELDRLGSFNQLKNEFLIYYKLLCDIEHNLFENQISSNYDIKKLRAIISSSMNSDHGAKVADCIDKRCGYHYDPNKSNKTINALSIDTNNIVSESRTTSMASSYNQQSHNNTKQQSFKYESQENSTTSLSAKDELVLNFEQLPSKRNDSMKNVHSNNTDNPTSISSVQATVIQDIPPPYVNTSIVVSDVINTSTTTVTAVGSSTSARDRLKARLATAIPLHSISASTRHDFIKSVPTSIARTDPVKLSSLSPSNSNSHSQSQSHTSFRSPTSPTHSVTSTSSRKKNIRRVSNSDCLSVSSTPSVTSLASNKKEKNINEDAIKSSTPTSARDRLKARLTSNNTTSTVTSSSTSKKISSNPFLNQSEHKNSLLTTSSKEKEERTTATTLSTTGSLKSLTTLASAHGTITGNNFSDIYTTESTNTVNDASGFNARDRLKARLNQSRS